MTKWLELAKEMGFTAAVEIDPAILEPKQEVRDMCASDKCHAYGHNWTCPPECGSLESCTAAIRACTKGILLQTMGQLEDSFDIEGMMELSQEHKERFNDFTALVKQEHPDALGLGTGGCKVCRKCAHPEPCRFPEKAYASMEGYGLVVSEACSAAGVPYYYGANTLAYTACVLW